MNCYEGHVFYYLPHPPPPIGGGLGPAPWVILPIRLLPPGGPGGLQKKKKVNKKVFGTLLMQKWSVSTVAFSSEQFK